MADARRRATAVGVAVVATLVASAAIALLWRQLVIAPVPVPLASPANPTEAAAPAAVASGAVAVAGDLRQPVPSSGTGGLAGTLLDGFGRPAPRLVLTLQSASAKPNEHSFSRGLERVILPPPTWHLVTDADGAFARGGLEPGRYTLHLGAADLHHDVLVTADAVAAVSLQLPRGKVLTTGCLLRGGKRVPLQVRIGDEMVFADADGWLTALLPPGRHRLEAVRPGHEPGPELLLGRHELFVPNDRGSVQYEFPLYGAHVEAVVEEAHGPHRQQVALILTGTPDLGGEPVSLRGAGAEGKVVLEHVPPGRWQAVMVGTQLPRTAPQSFVIGADTGSVTLTFAAAAGATVFLALRTQGGDRPRLPLAALPRLSTANGLLEAEDLSGVKDAPAGAKQGFLGVPPGPVELVVDDPEQDGEVTFLGVDVPVGLRLQLAPQAREVLTVDVVRRARVELVAASTSGREDTTAKLSLFAGPRRVRAPEAGRGSQWSGWLPPGDYRIVIERGSAWREHDLVVGRSDVRLRLRP
ncbi:MAG: hypothetical protein MUC36_26385 [Planctomycetes bacterium]|nr:hypothetical protein [Planctomycetota bacterium]